MSEGGHQGRQKDGHVSAATLQITLGKRNQAPAVASAAFLPQNPFCCQTRLRRRRVCLPGLRSTETALPSPNLVFCNGSGRIRLACFQEPGGDGRPAPSVRPSRRRLNPVSLQRRDFNTDGLILYYLQGGAVPLLHELSFSDTTFAILDNKAGASDLSARGVLTSNRRSELSARRAKELEMLSKTSLARSKKWGSVTTARAVYSRFLSQRRFCLLQDLSELHHCNGHQGIPLHMQPQLFYRINGYDLLSPRRKLVCQALCREDFSVS